MLLKQFLRAFFAILLNYFTVIAILNIRLLQKLTKKAHFKKQQAC